MGLYCGECGTKVKRTQKVCPKCRSDLSKTRVSATEEELMRADKWLDGRKGFLKSRMLQKRILPYETWLAVYKNLSLREFGDKTPEERAKLLAEYEAWLKTR